MSGRIRFIFAWYDLWVGAYYDRTKRLLYILPVPMVGVCIDLQRYYAIIGGYTGTPIGTCTGDDLAFIQTQEPRATFTRISKTEWERNRS